MTVMTADQKTQDRIAVRWPDGTRTTARSYRQLMSKIRRVQWEHTPSQRQLRDLLAHRAEVWSGHRPSTRGSSRAFVRRLAEAGMFTIERPARQ